MNFDKPENGNVIPLKEVEEIRAKKAEQEREEAIKKMEAVLREVHYDQNPLRRHANEDDVSPEEHTKAELENMRNVIARVKAAEKQDKQVEGQVARLYAELNATLEGLSAWGGEALIGEFQAVKDELVEAFQEYLKRITTT